MPETTRKAPAPWADEFTQPTLAGLVEGLEAAERPAFEAAVEALKGRKGGRERVTWQGLPWRWTVCVTVSGVERPALAYLVPRPGGPFVCIPVPIEGPGAPGLDELSKAVRSRLSNSPVVAGFVWAEWPVSELDLVTIKPLLEARETPGGAGRAS
ncbi:MAG: hypothetical protein H6810_06935 [Phycisphaeraceae bacterium]|nr:MAG: hypothetical protein H6810_06935 [Phycisphaeraceae bacterium]